MFFVKITLFFLKISQSRCHFEKRRTTRFFQICVFLVKNTPFSSFLGYEQPRSTQFQKWTIFDHFRPSPLFNIPLNSSKTLETGRKTPPRLKILLIKFEFPRFFKFSFFQFSGKNAKICNFKISNNSRSYRKI